MVKNNEESNYYNSELQQLLIQFMVSSPDAYVRCQNIVEPSYWDEPLRPAVRYIKNFVNKYKALPTVEQVNTESKIRIDKIDDIRDNHLSWFYDTVESFCRHKAMEQLILDGPKLLEDGRYAEIEKRTRENMLISLQKDLGTDYFTNPAERLERMRTKTNTTSTGWKDVDEKLYGGLNRGEITIFAAQSGGGKSLFLQNLALNWVMMGLNVVYITLELSEELIGLRIDSMVTNIPSREIFRDIENVAIRLNTMKKKNGTKWGKLQIKSMPGASTTANDIKAYLREYEVQTGVKPDAICVDYLDLLMPYSVKVPAGDQFIKDKYTSEELRALAIEYNLLCATASQLNRGSVEQESFNMAHIAGGISKINTTDNLIAIQTSALMKEKGEFKLQFLKTRSSAGVGSSVMLSVNPDSLRITDYIGDSSSASSSASELDRITQELREKRQKLTLNKDYVPNQKISSLLGTENNIDNSDAQYEQEQNFPTKIDSARLRNLLKHSRND